MQTVVTQNYELTYDEDQVVLVDKINNELIIRIFNNEISKLNIEAHNTDVNMNVKNLNVIADRHINLSSNLPSHIPSIFLNCTQKYKPEIISDLVNIHSNVQIPNLIGI